MRSRPSRHPSLLKRCLQPSPAAKRAHSKRSNWLLPRPEQWAWAAFPRGTPYGFLLNCRSARLAYFERHVVRCPHSTPLPRLPGADEVRQGDPAAGSPAGAFRFPLYPLQSGGNHYAGSVCLVRHGLAEAQHARRSVVRTADAKSPICRVSSVRGRRTIGGEADSFRM